MEDKSEVLHEPEEISVFRSIVGSGIYLCQERYVAFTVKELASRMLNPTAMSFHRLKKFLGYLKKTMDSCLVLEFAQEGEGYVKKGESYWCLETFSHSDWSGNKGHRKSTSGGFHALNSCPSFNSCRTQNITSLSSCEAELHAIVSSIRWNLYQSTSGICSWDLHRFIERAPTCDKERSWKSAACRWKVAVDSEQERLQDGTSTNRQQHGRPQHKATWRTKNKILDAPNWLLAQ